LTKQPARQGEGSGSFSEEKEGWPPAQKRLLLIWAMGVAKSRLQNSKSFLRRFFFKKAAASLSS
jgi:hypothetical protein